MRTAPAAAGLAAALAVAGCAAEEIGREGLPVAVEATVEPQTATLGDLVEWRIAVRHPRGWEIEIADPPELAGLAHVDRRLEASRGLFGPRFEELAVTLRAVELGEVALPPVEVRYRRAGAEQPEGAAASPPLSLTVASVLPEDGPPGDLRDLKPLRRLETWKRPAAIAAGVLALLAAAAALGWWWRRRRAARPAAPGEPAHETALRELERLRGVDPDDETAVRRFHFALSATLRAYVEGRFGLNATDLTTEEILPRLAELEELAARPAETLRHVLAACDRVKFAHAPAFEPEIDAAWEGARGFVETTLPPEGEEREAA